MLKALKFGSNNDKINRVLFLEMCEKADFLKTVVCENGLPSISILQELSKLNDKEFEDRCFSFYIGIEEDDWDPSQEICALCLVMKIRENKFWNIELKDWVI